jgi:hypothetical protein
MLIKLHNLFYKNIYLISIDTIITLCWPHIALNCLPKHKDKLQKQDMFDTIKTHLTFLHSARSQAQFTLLAKGILNRWRMDGEGIFAEYFQNTYLTEPYNKWSTTVSENPGITANQIQLSYFMLF